MTSTGENSRPRVLGLVADDLTGAADSAAGFAEHGWAATLYLDPDELASEWDDAAPIVLAISTGSRALADDWAAALTARAVDALLAAGAERLYLKIDSTVRGSVAGQVEGALAAWARRHPRAGAVICPAFPAQHRTVAAGNLLVNGVPVGQTAAAADPVTPRTISDLTRIVPGAVRGTLMQAGCVSRLVLDAATDTDLDAIAAQLAGAGPDLIMVGSGGLAAALGRSWSHTSGRRTAAGRAVGRILVAVSSLHPVTAGQLNHLYTGPDPGDVDVLTTSTDGTTTPTDAADELADRVAAALADRPYGALVLVGGDGAAAILARLAADSLVVDGTISGGCPTGMVNGGVAAGLRLITKSGGFGDPTTLATITSRLRAVGVDPRTYRDHAAERPTQKESS